MKRILIASLLLFLLSSVGIGLWFYISRARSHCDGSYIPAGIITNGILTKHVPAYYSAMQEAPLSCFNSRTETYRFLFIPSWDSPASIRIWREENHSFVAIKQLRDAGVPKDGAKDLKVNKTQPLSDDQWNRFKGLVARASFWTAAPEISDLPMLDGAAYVLEGHDGHNYHVIIRAYGNESFMDVTDFFFDSARLQWRQ
jgi:hypothetical protein